MSSNDFTVVWTNQALKNSLKIKEYLFEKFTDREILKFYQQLSIFEHTVSSHPEIYPLISSEKKIRRAVISRELSVFYRIHDTQIEVLAIFDNRCDLSDWI